MKTGEFSNAIFGENYSAADRMWALQLLLPFAAGQLARPLIGRWLANHKGLTSIVDRGSMLL